MPMRVGVIVAILLVAVLGFMAWKNNQERPQTQTSPPAAEAPQADAQGEPQGMPPAGMVAPPTATDPGMTWTVPKNWLTQITGGMRLATYIVPGPAKDTDAECAVYYFGPGAGGGVDANLARWEGEFGTSEARDVKHRDVNGIKLSVISLRGTFSGHAMKSGEESGPHANWGLLGAIAEGPHGDVFFKMTGPAKTIDAAGKPFDAMLSSLKEKAATPN